MLGYENELSSYRILRLRDRKIIITKHVDFIETSYPGLEPLRSNAMTNPFELQRFQDLPQTEVKEEIPASPIIDETSLNQSSDRTISSDISTSNILAYDRRGNPIVHLTEGLSQTDPTNYAEALDSNNKSKWMLAIKAELENMRRHDVWEEATLPSKMKPLK